MTRAIVGVILVSACSKAAPDVTVENGVRVHYVGEPATCILAGNNKDVCSMQAGAIRGGVKQDAWACNPGTTKTGGSAVEWTCWVSVTVCNEAVVAMREAIANKDPDAADITSVGDCEIYRVRK